MPFKITSFNVKGHNNPSKRHSLWSNAHNLKCDVLCLQEMHFAHNNAPSFTHKRFPHIYFANAAQKKRGVLIAIKDTVHFKPLEVIPDDQGRFIILIGEIKKAVSTIANIYAPNTKQISLFKKLWKKIQKKKGNLLLCRDFNTVPLMAPWISQAPTQSAPTLYIEPLPQDQCPARHLDMLTFHRTRLLLFSKPPPLTRELTYS